ncbi:MAG: glycoside hydrolase [Bacteroidetes bacterium]|nr:glycoside hydrolase [Bacteroidota bacterium]
MRTTAFFIAAILFISQHLIAQPIPDSYFNAMQWRMIGPHRGGRTVGAVGVPQQPNVFYIGVNNGGIWKTTDFGRTWKPIFDDQPTGSIGDIAVAPSDPNILYAGSGEGIQRPDLSTGDGLYKSTDAGATWSNIALNANAVGQELKEAQQIGGLTIDPNDANILFVAALGHPYGPNKERGVYRTLDGGRTWKKVLYIDENTGAIQVTIDPRDPKIIFADMWAGRQGPWENGAWNGKESGLFKSTDGGNTWKKITKGLPTTEQGLGRIGFCIAPSNNQRMYATVDAGKYGGVYRSDDAGESWYLLSNDNRLWGRGADFAEIKTDPKNPDIVYSANVVTWKSMDGGHNWTAFRGAPGGDDYHRIWINPDNPEIILIASDQGAIITVNGGQTFSSWYNQPTAQFYHVSTDNAFPYNVYGGQQESGSVGIASRGNDGAITFREWHPVGVEEYGYVAADPLDPNIIYGGKITRYDKRTGQTQNIAPETVRSGKYRFLRTAPVLFNPIDNKTLYLAGNVLFKTSDGGNSWEVISPDLSRETWDIPASVGIYTSDELRKMPRRGVIYTVAPSFKNKNTIWCGTDDGLIHITRDGGKTWKNITPPSITAWSKISLIDAGHFDENTAYVAVNRIRCDDMGAHIYKTHDGGKTWTKITNGLPDAPINVVREDPYTKGLLFAGSEKAVYVSFDDGNHWQSLRLNMPATSIRDLVIKQDDIVVGTHGRSFWILDNISPLRDLESMLVLEMIRDSETLLSKNILYAPQTAFRVRWNMNTDTPLPQEEPAGQNPPDGAIIDYYLNQPANHVILEIHQSPRAGDGTGRSTLIRRYTSNDTASALPADNTPPYWVRPQQVLSIAEGSHRFIWDMHYTPLPVPASFPISATYLNTTPEPSAPWVMPGKYKILLIVDGKTFQQELKIKMDPRVKTPVIALQQQFDLSYQCYNSRKICMETMEEIQRFRSGLQSQLTNAEQSVADKLGPLEKEAGTLVQSLPGSEGPGFERLQAQFATLFNNLQDSDWPPTTQTISAVKAAQTQLEKLLTKWKALKAKQSAN